jgi:very-short-patch-repair endonuclease
VDGKTIDRRVRARRLTIVRRGIYRLGPIAQPLETEMAAVLSIGGPVGLSHRSAAMIHGLPQPASAPFVEVTVWDRQPGTKPGIRIHRTKDLPADELTHRHGLPVITPARTILDLAPSLGTAQLEQLLAHGHRKGIATATELDTLIARYPGRPGTPALKALVHGRTEAKFTRSSPERRLLAAFRRAGLDEPQTNAPIEDYEVDFLWEERQLVLEVDGHPFHSARPDRRRDYARDARLNELGYRMLRVDADVEPERAVALVARAMA